ncbi:hypothetical protein [Halorhabdus sp. CUG00001]|uniref:hypothetical protein n=1 Tax=Halorhabdus sp. CUG00001 TaxID=2600297 RepID=UPI00131DC2DF|nr:hypothetical protein [Halorhabdus sp. CUG00001]
MATNTDNMTLADQIAMGLGGGLFLLGTVGIGLLEIIAGNMNPMVVGTNADGETVNAISEAAVESVQNAPVIPPNVRAYLLTFGLVILGVFAIYAFATQQHLD